MVLFEQCYCDLQTFFCEFLTAGVSAIHRRSSGMNMNPSPAGFPPGSFLTFLVGSHRNPKNFSGVGNDLCMSREWSSGHNHWNECRPGCPLFFFLRALNNLSWLVVWLPFLKFSHILGMSSSQLTNIFQRGGPNHQPVSMWKIRLPYLVFLNPSYITISVAVSFFEVQIWLVIRQINISRSCLT